MGNRRERRWSERQEGVSKKDHSKVERTKRGLIDACVREEKRRGGTRACDACNPMKGEVGCREYTPCGRGIGRGVEVIEPAHVRACPPPPESQIKPARGEETVGKTCKEEEDNGVYSILSCCMCDND